MGKEVISPLRQRMIEDMNARKLGKHSQRSHIHSCKRFVKVKHVITATFGHAENPSQFPAI
jgi:hypothetical protein